jgi:hypothetical protein
MRIYLAGPMRGYDEFNFPAFKAAAAALRKQGHHVFNPAENSAHDADIRTCMAIDTAWICNSAEGIALLPGWKGSKGARAEFALAEAIGLPMFFVEERDHGLALATFA